jgi:hypothetical protein
MNLRYASQREWEYASVVDITVPNIAESTFPGLKPA